MAQLNAPFNPQDYDPENMGPRSLPIGRHLVAIASDTIEATKKGDAGMLVLKIVAIDGVAKGQSIIDRLNLYNPSDQARQIAHDRLSAYAYAIGEYNTFVNTQVLWNRQFSIEVGYRELTDEQLAKKAAGENVTPFTEIKAIYDAGGNPPRKPVQASAGFTPQPQPVQQQQPSAPAWPGQQPQQQQPQPPAAWGPQPPQQPAGMPPAQAPAWAPSGPPATPAWANNNR